MDCIGTQSVNHTHQSCDTYILCDIVHRITKDIWRTITTKKIWINHELPEYRGSLQTITEGTA